MTDVLLILAILILIGILVAQVMLLRRRTVIDFSPLNESLSRIDASHERTERAVRQEIGANRQEVSATLGQSREEVSKSLKTVGDTLHAQLGGLTQSNDQRLDAMRAGMERKLDGHRLTVDERLKHGQEGAANHARELREEVLKGMSGMADLQGRQIEGFSAQLGNLVQSNQTRLDALKLAVEEKLKSIQEDNARQIDQMRQTVDEKLQGALEKRLGESFKQVSERLEAVHKGLGEMQSLASGVGDLKKVLTNVKTRGVWGEVQLGALLEQVLMPDQYAVNFAAKNGGERVEFAVKMPGRSEEDETGLWLPIDAKFPLEGYQRLIEAQERGDIIGAEEAAKQIEAAIKKCAWDINGKYLNPPLTTGFAILFLPTEGLFAEVLRRRGLEECVRRDCNIIIAGPTTLWAILSGLQMGFRTLAIQKRSSEVWDLLAAVKTEWGKYGEVLARVGKKLQEATHSVEEAERRTRVIGRKLKDVQDLPVAEAEAVLMLDLGEGVEES